MEFKEKVISHLKKSLELIQAISQTGLKVAIEAEKEILLSLKKVEKEEDVLIVFVGTYSSGKSTIIKRLTGKDLKTGINPTTNEIDESILWHNAKIADTPGLKSDQTRHDRKTEDFVGKADIVVWVCEADRLILESHREPLKKIALEMSKEYRILIVINKLDTTGIAIEDKSERQKMKKTKSEEIRRILKECNISADIPIIQISADLWQMADSLSIEQSLEIWSQSSYYEISEFDVFVKKLTKFIEKYGSIAKFKGAVDRTHEYLRKIISDLKKIRQSSVGTNEFIFLHQKGLEKISERIVLRANVLKASQKKNLNSLVESNLKSHVDNIGKYEDLEKLQSIFDENKINALIENFCAKSLENTILEFYEYFETLSKEEEQKTEESYIYKEIMANYGNLKILFSVPPFDHNIQSDDFDFQIDKEGFVGKNFKEIGSFIKTGIEKGINTLPKDYKPYHEVIYNIGKKFNVKFKPHQASNMAKKIASGTEIAGKCIPIITGLISIGIDIFQFNKADKEIKKLQEEKKKAIDALKELENNIWIALEEEFDNRFNAVFQSLKEHIQQLEKNKEKNESLIIAYDIFLKEIELIQKNTSKI